MTGSGALGNEVTVAVGLALRPLRGRRSYVVDAVAVDDRGTQQVQTGIGTLRVR